MSSDWVAAPAASEREVPEEARPSRPDAMLGHLPELARYVLHADSWLAMGVLALVISTLEWLGSLPWELSRVCVLLARISFATYFYLVARKAAVGAMRLPIPSDYRDLWDELIHPLLQGAVIGAWFFLPLAAYGTFITGLDVLFERYDLHPMEVLRRQTVGAYLAIGLGFAYLPTGIVAAVVRREVLPLFDPSRGFRLLAPVGGAYAVTFILLCALTVVAFVTDTLGILLQRALPVPVAGAVLRHFITLWVPLAQARLVGAFCYVNRAWLSPASARRNEQRE
ncbi:MAG: hypothetical protein IT371_21940 [Deltaproteobacteria bacterium]|nr:hypothetical protein [Deltaproteobacteria bacterium]